MKKMSLKIFFVNYDTLKKKKALSKNFLTTNNLILSFSHTSINPQTTKLF